MEKTQVGSLLESHDIRGYLFLMVDGKLKQYIYDRNHLFRRYPREDRAEGRIYLYRQVKGIAKGDSPKKVYLDCYFNDEVFIDMNGDFYAISDFEKTKEYKKLLVNSFVYSPETFMPIEKTNFDGHVKFGDIPSDYMFISFRNASMETYQDIRSMHGIDPRWAGMMRYNKYAHHTIEVSPNNYLLSGHKVFCRNYAVSSDFYEPNKEDKWHDPLKKIVKVKHFISEDYFITEDLYICKTEFYKSFLSSKSFGELMRRRWYLLTQ